MAARALHLAAAPASYFSRGAGCARGTAVAPAAARWLSGGGSARPAPAPPTHPSGLTLYGSGGRGMGLDVPPSREPLYRESPLNLFFQRYYYLLKGVGVFSRRANTGVNSEAIFRSLEEQATQDAWWVSLGLQRDWITEHALISLHVWMFHNRFKVRAGVCTCGRGWGSGGGGG